MGKSIRSMTYLSVSPILVNGGAGINVSTLGFSIMGLMGVEEGSSLLS